MTVSGKALESIAERLDEIEAEKSVLLGGMANARQLIRIALAAEGAEAQDTHTLLTAIDDALLEPMEFVEDSTRRRWIVSGTEQEDDAILRFAESWGLDRMTDRGKLLYAAAKRRKYGTGGTTGGQGEAQAVSDCGESAVGGPVVSVAGPENET